MFARFDGGTINNSGRIHADNFGIAGGAQGFTTVINNTAAGTIAGPDGAVSFDAGRVALTNNGIIDGTIDLDAATGNVNDKIVNKGKITGTVALGSGNDNFTATGAGTSGKVFGEAGVDTLIGGKAADMFAGGAGNDTIRGGRGTDLMWGGANADIFDFNSTAESLKGAKRDVIQDFSHADTIDLKSIDAKTGVSGNNAFKFIGKDAFSNVRGELRYNDNGPTCTVQGDVNGDGKADFEILVRVGSLSGGDFLL